MPHESSQDGGPAGRHTLPQGRLALPQGRLAHLDQVDLALIGALEQDGRMAYRELAGHAGISESQVRRRVGRLVSSGVLRVVGVADVVGLGFIRAEVGVRVRGHSLRDVAQRLAGLPEADWVATCIGPVDVVVNVVCADHSSLLELVDREIRSIPGVEVVDTRVIVEVVKDDYRMLQMALAARSRSDRVQGMAAVSSG